MATAVDKAVDIAGEVVADAAESVAEEAQDVATTARAINSRDVGLLFGGTGVGIALGVAGGYLILKKKMETKYEKIADEEIMGMKEHYKSRLRALENQQEKKTLDTVVEDLKYATDGKDGGGKIPYHLIGSEPDKALAEDIEQEAADEADPRVVQNVFIQNTEDPEVPMTDGWNYAIEAANRTPDVPYVIHRDEYSEDTKETEGYEQYTLTYFEGDDVLCRDDDTIIEDQDATVGLGNLAKFGHGSGDPNIVYVRNEQLKVNLEIVHSDGTYAMEVHGLPPEDTLKHSGVRRRSPRRSEYDPDN